MAEVTGPISTLPGAQYALPEGAKCDEHPERAAVARVQGETDSFGSEMHDLCDECIAEIRKHRDEARKGVCDWCHFEATDLRAARDYDEGTTGPVYRVCGGCIKRYNEAERELYDDFDDSYLDESC